MSIRFRPLTASGANSTLDPAVRDLILQRGATAGDEVASCKREVKGERGKKRAQQQARAAKNREESAALTRATRLSSPPPTPTAATPQQPADGTPREKAITGSASIRRSHPRRHTGLKHQHQRSRVARNSIAVERQRCSHHCHYHLHSALERGPVMASKLTGAQLKAAIRSSEATKAKNEARVTW